MSGLSVKAVRSLAGAAAYFDHEMEQDRTRDELEPDRASEMEAQQEAERQRTLEAEREQREAEARERDTREEQEREQREAEAREREAKDAQDREAEARQEQEREAQRDREAAEERERAERERQPDASWQTTGVHASEDERDQRGGSGLLSWGDEERSSRIEHIRLNGQVAEDIWAGQARAEDTTAAALRADLREQFVSAGLTGRMADERLDQLEEMIEKAAKLGDRITVTRDEFSGDLVWNVHNAERSFGSDLERLQFQDRLQELELVAEAYGVAFTRHDGPGPERVEFERVMNVREQALARASVGHGMDFDR